MTLLRSSVQPKPTCMSFVSLCFLFANGMYSSDKYEEQRRVWGGGLRGKKSTQMLRKRAKASGIAVSAASIASSRQ